jgi:hypothetical protein
MGETLDSWPAGATFVFQGTVAEDATAGTHVVSLIVAPGEGAEFEVDMGRVVIGATATSQSVSIRIDDGTNILAIIYLGSHTTSGLRVQFPFTGTQGANVDLPFIMGPRAGYRISGPMRFIMEVTTTAVSVTQTFAVVCRIKGPMPTTTLADTVGAPTLATNTRRVM